MKVQGKFKMQAHIMGGVVMDITAFKVSHSSGIDIGATALRAARARSSSIGALDKNQGMFKRQAHILIVSLISVHVGVGQRCCAIDAESPAILPTTSTHNHRGAME